MNFISSHYRLHFDLDAALHSALDAPQPPDIDHASAVYSLA
jgi:hypothetical protein